MGIVLNAVVCGVQHDVVGIFADSVRAEAEAALTEVGIDGEFAGEDHGFRKLAHIDVGNSVLPRKGNAVSGDCGIALCSDRLEFKGLCEVIGIGRGGIEGKRAVGLLLYLENDHVSCPVIDLGVFFADLASEPAAEVAFSVQICGFCRVEGECVAAEDVVRRVFVGPVDRIAHCVVGDAVPAVKQIVLIADFADIGAFKHIFVVRLEDIPLEGPVFQVI